MRPGNQSNKRMRGRGRKGPNPLTRTFESNGPDVKIRGTAQHIAEKYQQLARDAQASGDRVMGENYLQHAEHYLRIIAAAQPQQVQQPRQDSDEASEGAPNGSPTASNGERRRPERQNGSAVDYVDEDSPQPFIERMPTIDPSGQVTSQDEQGEAEAKPDADAEEEKPRRKPRVARGRPRKVVSEDADAGENEVSDAPVSASEGEQEEAKPRARRTTRPRRTKKADEALEVEAAPAGE